MRWRAAGRNDATCGDAVEVCRGRREALGSTVVEAHAEAVASLKRRLVLALRFDRDSETAELRAELAALRAGMTSPVKVEE